MKTAHNKTIIAKVETSVGMNVVPAKTRKSDKKMVIRFSCDSNRPRVQIQ